MMANLRNCSAKSSSTMAAKLLERSSWRAKGADARGETPAQSFGGLVLAGFAGDFRGKGQLDQPRRKPAKAQLGHVVMIANLDTLAQRCVQCSQGRIAFWLHFPLRLVVRGTVSDQSRRPRARFR